MGAPGTRTAVRLPDQPDAFGRPLALVVTGGNATDCTQFACGAVAE